MTSKLKIPKTLKVNNMSEGMKGLVGKRFERKAKFMGQDIIIQKLNVAEVREVQKVAKEGGDTEDAGFNVLKLVIRLGVTEAEDLSDEDFDTFSIDEISKLAQDIMKFSGIAGEGK